MLAMPLPAGDLGTWFTVQRMRALVNQDRMKPNVRLPAATLVSRVPLNDPLARADLIRDYLTHVFRFVPDPTGVEQLHPPSWQMGQVLTNGVVTGDCDDVAVLAAALGKAVGLVARFVLIGFGSPTAPYRHIWTELAVNRAGPWVECDITRPMQDLPPVPSRVKVVEV
jgi:transglutaminase-like putative cysteine protease